MDGFLVELECNSGRLDVQLELAYENSIRITPARVISRADVFVMCSSRFEVVSAS